MKNLITVMILALLAVSCRELTVEDMFYPEETREMVEKTAEFTVSLTSEDLERSPGIEPAFREKAMEQCFALTSRKVMQLQPLLKGGHTSAFSPDVEFARFDGKISPRPDDLTDDLVQDFQCSLKVSPAYSLAGEIVGLEENRTMVARGDRVVLLLFGESPPSVPAYFVIGRKTTEHGLNLISIFGSGKIVQIIGEAAFHEEEPDLTRTMARGVVLETSHEVTANDMIFLALMEVNALEAGPRTGDIQATSTDDEVWVKPRVRDEISAPAEMK
jgi:hypothetical protein